MNNRQVVHTTELEGFAHDSSKEYLPPLTELSFHYLGFVYDENATNLDSIEFSAPQIVTAATSLPPSVSYDLNASEGDAANFHILYYNNNLVVAATALDNNVSGTALCPSSSQANNVASSQPSES